MYQWANPKYRPQRRTPPDPRCPLKWTVAPTGARSSIQRNSGGSPCVGMRRWRRCWRWRLGLRRRSPALFRACGGRIRRVWNGGGRADKAGGRWQRRTAGIVGWRLRLRTRASVSARPLGRKSGQEKAHGDPCDEPASLPSLSDISEGSIAGWARRGGRYQGRGTLGAWAKHHDRLLG